MGEGGNPEKAKVLFSAESPPGEMEVPPNPGLSREGPGQINLFSPSVPDWAETPGPE